MRVLILTHGTRGDVQPYAALALALRWEGHEATLAAPAASAALAEPYGLDFVPVHDGPNTLMADPELREAIETNYRGIRGKKIALQVMRRSKPLLARVLADMARVAERGADVIVHAPNIPGCHIAEKLGVPAVPALLQPIWVPTEAFRNPMLPIPLPRALNRASYLPLKLMLRSMGGKQLREDILHLPRRKGAHDFLRRPDGEPATVLQGFSPHVLPDGLDYPAWVHTTGFWFLPAPPDWEPSAELAAFLDAGDPPVYIGFGSMAGTDPRRLGRIVAEAVRLVGVRAVVAAGWGGIQIEDLPRETFLLDQAPHDWLFPHMAAVVHHGGSGTTGAALASGRPQVVCPFVADQPFWAERMHAAGVAPAPQPQRRLTAEGLAEAVRRAVTDRVIAERAERLAQRICAENGAAQAVDILKGVLP
ncbi:glycosyltransferase [Streptosporangium sp. NPDC051022]|uniref:glycosyltransferase n=1 Tax=Streptosporangium sp. NPDC051022 TaxID=3155752 RepID=UPI0034431010